MIIVPVQALTFDLDDTLLDGSRFPEVLVQTCHTIAAQQPDLDAAQLQAANQDVWQRYWLEVEAPWTLGTLDGATVTLEAWRRTLAACGCIDEALARVAATTHWRLGCATHQLFDDVAAFVSTVRTAGVPLALVTNGAADTQRDKLRVLGIERWFTALVISGDLGMAKPDARVFERAVHQLGVAREHTWHIGDSLVTDVAGAKAAGLRTVWLNRRGGNVSPLIQHRTSRSAR